RLARDDDALVGPGARDRGAVDALRLLAEPLVEGRGIGDLYARLGERLALLEREQRGELLLPLEHEVGEPSQDGRTLLRGAAAPRGKGLLSGLDRAARLRRAQARHRSDPVSGGRIDDGKGLARVGVDPAPVDVGLL